MRAERFASATFEEIWAEVIDPLYLEAASTPGTPPSRDDTVLDVLALWMLHSVAARSGLDSLVAEEPPWIAARIGTAARRVGLDAVATLWDRATGSANPAGRFVDEDARRELESLLVTGRYADLNRWLADRVREEPTSFVR